MANNSQRTVNLLNYISKRYSTASKSAQQKTIQKLPLQKEGLRVTKLSNGIVVASLENYSPISRVSAVINVGSRNESYDLQGSSHYLRLCSNLATKNFTSYGLTRTLDHLGADFSVSSTREQTLYNLSTARDNFDKTSAILAEAVSLPLFKDWEIEDARARLQLDLEIYKESPEIRIVDYLHKAAFRNGLSNPIYASEHRLDNFNSTTLKEFKAQNFSADRLSLIGVGIRHENLVKLAERFKLPSLSLSKPEIPRYLGSEFREETSDEIVHVAIASEGVGLSNKDLLASGIINQAFGVGSRIKWNFGGNKISRACSSLASEPFVINSFNLNYLETGLFGFHIIAHRDDTGKLLKGVFKECAKVSKNGFTNEEIASAKNSLKASLGVSLESSTKYIESIGLNPENATSYTNFEELSKAIDAIPANSINSLAKKVFSSKASLAAIGDLRNLPRIDELSA